MKEEFKGSTKEIHPEFTHVERLIEAKKFKEALAELREFEQTQKLDCNFPQYGWVCRLWAETLYGLGRYKEALSKGKKAYQILKHTSENRQIARLQFNSGLIYIALGDLKNGQEELRDSLATYRRIDDQTGIMRVLNRLAGICFVKSDYEKAIQYLLDCIDMCDGIGDEAAKARFLGNAGSVYMLTGRWHAAAKHLELNIKSNRQRNDLKNLSIGLFTLGYVCHLKRDFEKAKACCEEGMNIAKSNGYLREYAICHEYLGEFAFVQGDCPSAREHYLEAIDVGEKIADESGIMSQTYRLLAELQIAERQYKAALSSCEKALKVATSLGEKIEIGAIHRALGQIHTAKKEDEKAKESFEKSISILEQIGAKFELGKACLEAGASGCLDFFDRIHYLRRAKDVFKELDSQYHEGLVHFSISKLFFDKGEYEKASLFLNDAEKIFKELNEEKELSRVLSFRRVLERASGPMASTGGPEAAADAKSRYTFSKIVTRNPNMRKIIEQVAEVKNSNLTILLEGETGTGKDLVAKTIHFDSRRGNKKFVPVQCAAIPEALLENALFGHVKGAYTHANESCTGFFQEAAGGTLYLDEIAEIPLSTQVKLLRVIEEKEVTRIGETKPQKVDVRIIASTSRNLAERVSEGLFRKDLYYRLNPLTFRLPSLAERKEDISLLIEYFLKDNGFGEDGYKILDDPEFMESILQHDWQGNVRELKHEIEKLVALSVTNYRINPNSLKESLDKSADKPRKLSLCDEVAELEKTRIMQALKQTGANKSRASKILGIPESTLWNKLKKHKIE